ncbi:hypothetical protein HYDPIDRAFT_108191, partial [Hydnomerulius pinastri MD-312]
MQSTRDELDGDVSVESDSGTSSSASSVASSRKRQRPSGYKTRRQAPGQQSLAKSDYVPYLTRRVMKQTMEDEKMNAELADKLASTHLEDAGPSTLTPTFNSYIQSHSRTPSPVPVTLASTAGSSTRSWSLSSDLNSYVTEWLSGIPNLTGRVCKLSEHPVAFGGFSDIWSCTLDRRSSVMVFHREEEDDRDHRSVNPAVAVKAVRIHADGGEDIAKKCKRVTRELEVWKRLKHSNILPLYGVTFGFGPLPAMVCPWMDHGTITTHLQQGQLSMIERWELLCDTIAGLDYLHSESVIHGDLSGANILINRYGNAVLSDFGLSTILLEFFGNAFFTSTVRGSIRWTAPELICFHDGPITPSRESDMYSFGSIMFQVLSGEVPYSNLKNDAQVIFAISQGIIPLRPQWIHNRQWGFIQQCWSKSLGDRPTSREASPFVDEEYLRS